MNVWDRRREHVSRPYKSNQNRQPHDRRRKSHFDYEKLRSRESYVLDLSGPVGNAAVKAPSLATFEVTVRGRAAHAGFAPENGVHAVQAAANAVSKLELGHVGGQMTVNIGKFSGGTTTNVIPDLCIVQGEVRSSVHEELLRHLQVIRGVFEKEAELMGAEITFEREVFFKAYETPAEHRVVKRFRKAFPEP